MSGGNPTDTAVSAIWSTTAENARAADVESCLADGGAAVSAISVYELPAGVSSDRHVAQRMELVSLTTVIAGYQ